MKVLILGVIDCVVFMGLAALGWVLVLAGIPWYITVPILFILAPALFILGVLHTIPYDSGDDNL